MRCRKRKNYGSVPRNEYTMINTAKTTNSEALENIPSADGDEHERPLQKQQLHHLLGNIRNCGWLRSRSMNSWRAEAASQQDQAENEEFIDSIRKE